MKPYACGSFSPELTTGFKLVREWFSAASDGTLFLQYFLFTDFFVKRSRFQAKLSSVDSV